MGVVLPRTKNMETTPKRRATALINPNLPQSPALQLWMHQTTNKDYYAWYRKNAPVTNARIIDSAALHAISTKTNKDSN